MLTARLLAPAGRGELATITMWPQFLGFLLAFGVPTALVYHTQQGSHDRPQLVGAAVLMGAVTGILGGLLGTALLPSFLGAYSREVVQVVRTCMVFTPFVLVLNTLSSALLDERTISRYNYVRLAAPVSTLIALVVLALTGRLTVTSAAFAYLLPNVPISIWALMMVRRLVGIEIGREKTIYVALLTYGLSYFGAEIAGTISLQLDRVVVLWLLSPAAMGLYVVSLSFSRVFQQIPLSVSVVLLPKAAGATPRAAINMSLIAAFSAVGISLVVALPVLLFGSFLLRLFFGPGFEAAAPAFTILTVEAVLGGFVIIIGQAFLATGRPASRSLYEVIGLAMIAPLLLWLGPLYGIVGASLAVLGSTILRVVLMLAGILRTRRALEGE